MLHTTIGSVGHLLIIVSFVTSLVAAFGYFKATQATAVDQATDWRKFARWSFFVHGLAVMGVIASLFGIIYNHYFEYHYAWSHSSRALPTYYMISCFWEGQEGSFLLWIFWHVVLGVTLIGTSKTWEAPLMAVFALVQAFLCSMILGTVIPGLDLKIGSSPFLLLREAFTVAEAPFLATNPNYIPPDGNGLNPLLQNYWMVIHPPTLFLGFALTLVPFAFVIAGLWRKQYKEWVRPALPWALSAAAILGVGILMGAYWAYETLTFGGYWSWDPVENAVYVPWLVLIGAIHTMIVYRSSQTALRTAMILAIASFVLVLYATFLTRSGILGNASVHSFTDLGLSGQLLVYLLAFVVLAIGLLAWRWKQIPSDDKEATLYSREFWIFSGATVLCLASFQVLITTSIPVYNKIMEGLGYVSNLAPPADAISHYTKFQLWFFVIVAILTGIGQFVWWNRLKVGKTEIIKSVKPQVALRGMGSDWLKGFGPWEVFSTPLIITLLLTATVISVGKVTNPVYIVVVLAAIFALVANGTILLNVFRGNYKLSGGSVAHIGVALMLVGILFSSGYSRVVSINSSGLLISDSEDFTKNNNQENKENAMLWLGKPTPMSGYLVTYKGQRIEARALPGYFPKENFELIEGDFHAVAKQDVVHKGRTFYKKGDTLAVYPENTYFEVEYREPNGKVFSLYPRAQVNPKMGLIPSPDIRHSLRNDMYTHVSAIKVGDEDDWGKTERHTVALADTFFVNDYVAILDNVARVNEVEGVTLGPGDAAVQASIRVLDAGKVHEMRPTYVIKDRLVGRKPEINREVGLRVAFDNIDPKTGSFTFAVNTTQRDYIVMKALEKPLINVLWIGSLVMTLGFIMAIGRRWREFRLMQGKAAA